MLIRIEDQVINTDAIANAKFERFTVAGLGIPGSSVSNSGPALTIHLITGSELRFGSDVAEQIWQLLCSEAKTTIGPQEPEPSDQ